MPAQLLDVERTPLDTPQLPFRDLYAYVTRAAMPRLQAGNSLLVAVAQTNIYGSALLPGYSSTKEGIDAATRMSEADSPHSSGIVLPINGGETTGG